MCHVYGLIAAFTNFRFFGNHKSNDSLIGRTYCDAKGVHLIGNEMSLDLIEAFDRHKCGSITIHLSIRVKVSQ